MSSEADLRWSSEDYNHANKALADLVQKIQAPSSELLERLSRLANAEGFPSYTAHLYIGAFAIARDVAINSELELNGVKLGFGGHPPEALEHAKRLVNAVKEML